MYSNLLLDLAQSDNKKYTWISQLSLLFTFHSGYLIHDTGNEIEIELNGIYDSQVRFILRNHEFEDVNVLYAAVVYNKYNFLTEFIDSIPNLQILTIVNIGAGIGVTAICLASFFDNVAIRVFEPDELDFTQLKKNIILNKLEGNVVDAYRQCDDAVLEIKALDLLVCSPKIVNQLVLSGKVLNLVSAAKVIMVESFLSVEEKNEFIDYVSLLNFAHKCFGQTMVCWRP